MAFRKFKGIEYPVPGVDTAINTLCPGARWDLSNTTFVGWEDEILGIAFCKKLLGGNWKQTSYNNSMRVRYAGIGYSYNAALDAFVPPQPHDSWTLDNETADWISPLGAAPDLTEEEVTARSFYRWDEEAYQADNTTGWVLETPEASE